MIKFLSSKTSKGVWNVSTFRIRYQLIARQIPIRDSHDAARVLMAMWDEELLNIQEQIGALYLNPKNEAIGFRLISTGKLNTATLDIPLLLSCGLLCRASAIILAHNHPSGDPTPSRTDIRATLNIDKSISLVGMELHDHIILASEGYHSMADARNFLPRWMTEK